jgi:hypothetical protein
MQIKNRHSVVYIKTHVFPVLSSKMCIGDKIALDVLIHGSSGQRVISFKSYIYLFFLLDQIQKVIDDRISTLTRMLLLQVENKMVHLY